MEAKEKTSKKLDLESYFSNIAFLSAEDMLKDQIVIDRLSKAYGEDKDLFIDLFFAKSINYEPNVYFRVEIVNPDIDSGVGTGYGGVGKGLYLGRDKEALQRFYDPDDIGFKLVKYSGEPRWLDLLRDEDYQLFLNFVKSKGVHTIVNSNIGDHVKKLGFDGIRYYDAHATGEEFVLFNISALTEAPEARDRGGRKKYVEARGNT